MNSLSVLASQDPIELACNCPIEARSSIEVLGGAVKGGQVYNNFPSSLLEGNNQDRRGANTCSKRPQQESSRKLGGGYKKLDAL